MLKQFIIPFLPYIPEPIMWLFARRYIAGKNMEDAIGVAKELNKKNINITIDLLGEFIQEINDCIPYLNEYLALMERMKAEGIYGGVSIKPTMFGLLLDREQCYHNIKKIVKKAVELDMFVRLDMEDSKCVDLELNLFHRLFLEFPNHIGIVFQAYLRRTLKDIEELSKRCDPVQDINIRLCKGIYIESKKISFKDPDEINEHYMEDLQSIFKTNLYAAIATHDDYIVNTAQTLIKKLHIPESRYEFQMLYGVRDELRDTLAQQSCNLRVYIPYGKSWKNYSIRRFKENPQFLSLVLRQIFHF